MTAAFKIKAEAATRHRRAAASMLLRTGSEPPPPLLSCRGTPLRCTGSPRSRDLPAVPPPASLLPAAAAAPPRFFREECAGGELPRLPSSIAQQSGRCADQARSDVSPSASPTVARRAFFPLHSPRMKNMPALFATDSHFARQERRRYAPPTVRSTDTRSVDCPYAPPRYSTVRPGMPRSHTFTRRLSRKAEIPKLSSSAGSR